MSLKETRVGLNFVTILNRMVVVPQKIRVTPSPSPLALEFRLYTLDFDSWLGFWTLDLDLDCDNFAGMSIHYFYESFSSYECKVRYGK